MYIIEIIVGFYFINFDFTNFFEGSNFFSKFMLYILYTFLPIPSGLIIFIISLHKNLDKKYYTGIYYINVLYRDLLNKSLRV